jgi:hypothetical protein
MNRNGRVDIVDPKFDVFQLYDKIPAHQCTTYRDAMIGNWNSTNLSNAFFNESNIEVLQNNLIKGVFEMSKGEYLIGPQNCDTLKIIMRSIFLQHSSNLPNNINEQVNELNQLVLDYSIPQVFNSVTSYKKYTNDVSTLQTPINRPQQASNRSKTLELKRFI